MYQKATLLILSQPSKKRLAGKFVNAAKRKDFLVRVNELRVIEYYSR